VNASLEAEMWRRRPNAVAFLHTDASTGEPKKTTNRRLNKLVGRPNHSDSVIYHNQAVDLSGNLIIVLSMVALLDREAGKL
jgi:hypothetical protein